MTTARFLLLLELFWLAYSSAKAGMTEKTYLVPETGIVMQEENGQETSGEIYGIGIEKDGGSLFWFHKEVSREP